MPKPQKKSHFLRLCRIYFRRFRITVGLVVLALFLFVAYLDQVGFARFRKEAAAGEAAPPRP